MLTSTCHCGSVQLEVPRRPRQLTSCNFSICRRYGTLWAYYRAGDVRVICARGATSSYAWGSRSIRFVRCKQCGCITHWEAVQRATTRRMGVNARNFEPSAIRSIRIRRLDGARTWKYLD